MTVPPDMAERHGRMLARYAELSLTLAEDVHANAVAAPEPEQKAKLAEAFHRLGRALRQSVAWEAKLVRDRARDLRAAEADAAEGRERAVRRRREQVRAEVERQIYCEVELDQADAWLADFEERLETEALDDAFADEDLDAQVARLAAELGLTGEARHDYTPRRCRPRVADPALAAARLRNLLGWTDDDDGEDGDAEEGDEEDGEGGEAHAEDPEDAGTATRRPRRGRPRPRRHRARRWSIPTPIPTSIPSPISGRPLSRRARPLRRPTLRRPTLRRRTRPLCPALGDRPPWPLSRRLRLLTARRAAPNIDVRGARDRRGRAAAAQRSNPAVHCAPCGG